MSLISEVVFYTDRKLSSISETHTQREDIILTYFLMKLSTCMHFGVPNAFGVEIGGVGEACFRHFADSL